MGQLNEGACITPAHDSQRNSGQFNEHFKGESGSVFFDARNMWELMRVIAEQIEYCNVRRRHSVLGYLLPWVYIKQEVTLPQQALDLAQISA